VKIPIQNIYFLFLYAWKDFRAGPVLKMKAIDSPNFQTLLGHVLIQGTERLSKRGLERGYKSLRENTNVVRGRILVGELLKRNLLKQLKLHCDFDDLTLDIPQNQILKITLMNLLKTRDIEIALKPKIRKNLRLFDGVETISLNRNTFRTLQLSSHNHFYKFLLHICELIHTQLMPDEKTGGLIFQDILKDEVRMSSVFENFIRNFYKYEQQTYNVTRDNINWDLEEIAPEAVGLLPKMETDTSLRSPDKTIVVETKYYKETLVTGRYENKKFRSGHLYQLFAYLKNLEANGGNDSKAEGILLYPTVKDDIETYFKVKSHTMRVVTINLAQDWQKIRSDLLNLIEVQV